VTLQRHSILAAHVARSMFKDKRRAEDAFMAGMLHDIGHLILLACPAAAQSEIIRPALLGAYLLGLWGIPYSVVEAVAHHDDPSTLDHAEFELVDAIYLAHKLVSVHAPPGLGPPVEDELDAAYLQRLGISSAQLEAWRNATLEVVRGNPV
jgi:HD-like signal output (HDOD) protein